MSEAILKALMQLFALVVDIDEIKEISDKEKAIIQSFLKRQLSSELVERYMKVFDEFLHLYHGDHIDKDSIRDRKRTALTAVRILSICEKINEELEQTQKIYVLILLIEYISFGIEIREKELDFLETVASAFNIPDMEYRNILHFVAFSIREIPRKERVLLINNERSAGLQGVHHARQENLEGDISILHVESTNTFYLRYHGREDLVLNGQRIQSGLTYTFESGSSIRGPKIDPIFYSDVAGTFSSSFISSRISLTARNVRYHFKNSVKGIQDFNFYEESGKLVGIMGGSGVGKSTLLNVLNGSLTPQQGEILVNGFNLYDEKEREALKGAIGFIPQDDLLIEDLTVYQNLYYNARLCLDDLDETEIEEVVEQVLSDLDLTDIRDLKVGKPLSKVISGGQRKRVNIGLELLREPSILFVDEPTSGLSSVDSEMVMNLLKEQVYKGRLVVVNIHQPSSNLYKMFDRIIFLDRGGYQIYYGNPSEAVIYFKTQSNHANAKEDQCPRCGNVDPDQILQIIEAKIVNEHGKLSKTRKVSPSEWYTLFKEEGPYSPVPRPGKSELPPNNYSIPGLITQLKLFFTRDLLSKLTNRQYILISVLEAPLLAIILAFFTKYFHGTAGDPDAYIFRHNDNLPAYLFICVIVFLFIGLTMSSEEIIKDRRILHRESFLNLSRFSYLNAKVGLLFLMSAVQAITFVLLGNLIFEIRGMTFPHFILLFTTACFANMMGLNISSGLNSVITIYILVPFLLIPQILFSGVLVKFDKLHKSLTHEIYVPVIGELMTSKWAYEALTVYQFKNNRYNRSFFPVDQEISNARYTERYLLTTLESMINDADYSMKSGIISDDINQDLEIIYHYTEQLEEEFPSVAAPDVGPMTVTSFSIARADSLKDYYNRLKAHLMLRLRDLNAEKNDLEAELREEWGGLQEYSKIRNSYTNTKLSDMLLNKDEIYSIVEKGGILVRKFEPVYMVPASRTGRAHLYAPVKRIGNWEFETFWFNIMVIWFTTLILYVTLYYDLLRKMISYFERMRLRKKPG